MALSMMAPPCNRTLTGARSTSAAEAAKTTTVTKPSLKACMRCQCAHDDTAKTLSVHLQSSSPEHGSTRRTLQGDEGEGDVERGGNRWQGGHPERMAKVNERGKRWETGKRTCVKPARCNTAPDGATSTNGNRTAGNNEEAHSVFENGSKTHYYR